MKKFLDDVKGKTKEENDDLSFERHLPTPTEPADPDKLLGEGPSRGGMPDWYNWRIENWGTKWGPGEVDLDVKDRSGDTTAVFSFETAWAPPEAWLAHVAPQYPELSFRLSYREPGMGFGGVLGFHKGEEVEDDQWDLHVQYDVEDYAEEFG